VIVEFSGPVWEWRGPAPYHFVTVPPDEADDIAAIAGDITYGWGMVPVRGVLGDTDFTTALWPKDGGYVVPLKDRLRAAEGVELGMVVSVRLAIAED
jgi:hypothetical protein